MKDVFYNRVISLFKSRKVSFSAGIVAYSVWYLTYSWTCDQDIIYNAFNDIFDAIGDRLQHERIVHRIKFMLHPDKNIHNLVQDRKTEAGKEIALKEKSSWHGKKLRKRSNLRTEIMNR